MIPQKSPAPEPWRHSDQGCRCAIAFSNLQERIYFRAQIRLAETKDFEVLIGKMVNGCIIDLRDADHLLQAASRKGVGGCGLKHAVEPLVGREKESSGIDRALELLAGEYVAPCVLI